MEISGSILWRVLVFTAVVFYFTFLLLTSNRYGCPSSDVTAFVRPAVPSESNNIDLQKPTLIASDSIAAESKTESVVHLKQENAAGVGDKNVTDGGGRARALDSRRNTTAGDVLDSSVDRIQKGTATDVGESPTQLKHLLFGIIGSEKAWHKRRAYIESWWRPNKTRGYLFLDREPSEILLPWSPASPPYRISADLTKFLNKGDVTPQRIANGVKEVFNLHHEGMRWLVMGDDDSIFFLDNLVELLGKYDHTKYYYIGARSDFVLSNYLFSFIQGFGGAGFVLSYPLAKILAKEMNKCLLKYNFLVAADQTAMSCIADIGVSLTEHHGFHQIDMRGDISGLLSSHPNVPLISLHHFDMAEPIFPSMDRYESTRHLMKAAAADQPRMLQQTVCHDHRRNWTFSISWGYSAHIYEQIMPRSQLQYPIETFKQWLPGPGPPFYMFNTRQQSKDPCEAPHEFYLQSVEKLRKSDMVNTSYGRKVARKMGRCTATGNHSADSVMTIRVYSAAKKRKQVEQAECCDVIGIQEDRVRIRLRECKMDDHFI